VVFLKLNGLLYGQFRQLKIQVLLQTSNINPPYVLMLRAFKEKEYLILQGQPWMLKWVKFES